MHICYVDESGCTGTLQSSTSPVQPVFVIAGVILDQARLSPITAEFLRIKHEFFPGAKIGKKHPQPPQRFLDWVLAEIKGTDIKKNLYSTSRNPRRHTMRFLQAYVRLLEYYDIKIVGRLIVKGIGKPLNNKTVFTYSAQKIFAAFHSFLTVKNDIGMIVMDSREQSQNVNMAHSLFTQKFQTAGDPHARVVEMPTFGHSENHVGIQLADILCSTLLTPMALHAYCTGFVTSVHIKDEYKQLKESFGKRLRLRQYMYQVDGKHLGGITVHDNHAMKSAKHMFE